MAKDNGASKRGYGDGSVSRRKDGTWTARIIIGRMENGNPKIKAFYGKTENEVKKKLREYKKDSDTYSSENIAKLSLSQYMQNWLELYKKPALKPTSYDRLEDNKRLFIDTNIGYIQMRNVTPDDVQRFLLDITARKYGDGDNRKTYSHSTVKKVYMLLNACFKHAVAKGDLARNPVAPVIVPKQKEFEKKDIVILTEDEVEIFVAKAIEKTDERQHDFRLGYAYILMLYTGLRAGELLALRWRDFDEANKTISVPGNIVTIKNRDRVKDTDPKYINVFQTSKTQASQNRVIPLSKLALKAILELKTINGNIDYICGTRNNTPMSKRNLDRTYRNICAKAGIKPTGLHSLRHTFASMLFRKGADIKTVSEILGHANTKITLNTYIHIIPEQKVSAIALLDNL